MDLSSIILLVIAGISLVLFCVSKIWGINLMSYILQAKPVLSTIISIISAVSNLLPSKYLKIALTVAQAAAKGAVAAEELWKIGELPKEERNAYAKTWAENTLTEANIEVTEQMKIIISGVIEVACILLPHISQKVEEENS